MIAHLCVVIFLHRSRFCGTYRIMTICWLCHVHPTSGHMGKTRTLCRIKERFMWHGMVKDANELLSEAEC